MWALMYYITEINMYICSFCIISSSRSLFWRFDAFIEQDRGFYFLSHTGRTAIITLKMENPSFFESVALVKCDCSSGWRRMPIAKNGVYLTNQPHSGIGRVHAWDISANTLVIMANTRMSFCVLCASVRKSRKSTSKIAVRAWNKM